METALMEGRPLPVTEPQTEPQLQKQKGLGEDVEDTNKSKKKKKKKKKTRRKSLERTQSEVEDMKAATEAQAQAQDKPEPEEEQDQQENEKQEQSEIQETAQKETEAAAEIEETEEQTNNQSEDETLPGPPDLERTSSLDSLKATSTRVTSMFSRFTSKVGRKKMPSRTESAAKLEGIVPSPVKTAVKKLEIPEEKDLEDLPMRTKHDFFEGSDPSIHVSAEKEKYDAMEKQRQNKKEEADAAAAKRTPPSSTTSNEETQVEPAVVTANDKESVEHSSVDVMATTMSEETTTLPAETVVKEFAGHSEEGTIDTEVTNEAEVDETEVETVSVVEVASNAVPASFEAVATADAIQESTAEAQASIEEPHVESSEDQVVTVSTISTNVVEDTVSDSTSESARSSTIKEALKTTESAVATEILSSVSTPSVAESASEISEPTKEQAEEVIAETPEIPSKPAVAESAPPIDETQVEAASTEELELLPVAVAPSTSELPAAATAPVQPEKMSPVKSLASRFEGKREQSLDSLKFRTVREFFPEERSVHVGAEKKKYETLTKQQKLKDKAEEEAKSKYKAGSSFQKSPVKESAAVAVSVQREFKDTTAAMNVTAAAEVLSNTAASTVEYAADNALVANVAEEADTTSSSWRNEKASSPVKVSSPIKASEAVTPVKSIASRFEGKREQSLDSLKFRTVREFFPEERSVRVGSEKQKFEAQSQQNQQDQSLDNLKFRTVREFFPEKRSVHVGAEKAKFEALTKQQGEAAKVAEQTKANHAALSPSLTAAKIDDIANAAASADGEAGVELKSDVNEEPAADINTLIAAVVDESEDEVASASSVRKSEGKEDPAEISTTTTAIDEVVDERTSITEEIDLSETTSANPAESSELSLEDDPISTATEPVDSGESTPPISVESAIHSETSLDAAENSIAQVKEIIVVSDPQLDNTDDTVVESAVIAPSEDVDANAEVKNASFDRVEEAQGHVDVLDQEVNQGILPTVKGLSEINLDGPEEDEARVQNNHKADAKPRPMLTTERSFVIEDDHTIETEDTVVVAERSLTDGEDEFEPLSASETLPAHQLIAEVTSPKAKETHFTPAKKSLTKASHTSMTSPSAKLTRKASIGSTGSAKLTRKASIGSTGSAKLTRKTSIGSTGSAKLTRKASIGSTGSAKSPPASLTVPIPMKRASITAPTASYMAKKAADAEELRKKSPPPKHGSASKLKGTVGPTGFIKPTPVAPTVPIPMKRASITAPTASYMARKAAEEAEAHQTTPPPKSASKAKGTVGPTGFIKPPPAAPTVPVPPRRASITAPTASWQARNVPNQSDEKNEVHPALKNHASKPKSTAGPTGFVKPIPPPPTVPVAPKRASISAPTASYMAKKSAKQTEDVTFAASVSKPVPRNSRYSNVKSKVLDGIESGPMRTVVHKTITKEEFIAAERRKSLGAAGVSSVLSAVDRRASLAGGMSLDGPPEPFVRSALSRKKLNSTVPRYMNYENTSGYSQRAREQYDRRKRLEMENAAKSEKRQKELRTFFAEKQRKALSSSADELRRGMEAHEFAQLVKESELEAKKTLRGKTQRSRPTRSHHRASSASSSADHSSSTGTASRVSKKSSVSSIEHKTVAGVTTVDVVTDVEFVAVEAEENAVPTDNDTSDEPEPAVDTETVSEEGSATKEQGTILETNQMEKTVPSLVVDEDPALMDVAKKINFDETSIDSDEKGISNE